MQTKYLLLTLTPTVLHFLSGQKMNKGYLGNRKRASIPDALYFKFSMINQPNGLYPNGL